MTLTWWDVVWAVVMGCAIFRFIGILVDAFIAWIATPRTPRYRPSRDSKTNRQVEREWEHQVQTFHTEDDLAGSVIARTEDGDSAYVEPPDATKTDPSA